MKLCCQLVEFACICRHVPSISPPSFRFKHLWRARFNVVSKYSLFIIHCKAQFLRLPLMLIFVLENNLFKRIPNFMEFQDDANSCLIRRLIIRNVKNVSVTFLGVYLSIFFLRGTQSCFACPDLV